MICERPARRSSSGNAITAAPAAFSDNSWSSSSKVRTCASASDLPVACCKAATTVSATAGLNSGTSRCSKLCRLDMSIMAYYEKELNGRIVKQRIILVNYRSGRRRWRRESMAEPTQESLDKIRKFVQGFAEKSGTAMHPNTAVTEAVVKGLASHID